MPSPLDDLDRYLLITADSHAGPSAEAYGPYLAKRWQEDFRGWLDQSEQMAKVMRQVMGDRSIGVDGDPDIDGDRNWDTATAPARNRSGWCRGRSDFSQHLAPVCSHHDERVR